MHLSQFSFHMVTFKAPRNLKVTDRYGSDLNVYEPVSLIHTQYKSALPVSVQQCLVTLRAAAHCREKQLHKNH